MPKKNPMLAKLEAQMEIKYAILFQRKMDILLQMGQDAANFAAHDTLGMGPGRAVAFNVSYREHYNRIARLTVDDAADDPEIWYTKAKIDEELGSIVGPDNLAPWDERYYGKKENP